MKKVLITRPRLEADELADTLTARGFEPLVEPLLSIRPVADGAAVLQPLLDGAQAVLFTSANGARAFAAATERRDLRAFAVGDISAESARAAGMSGVESAGGSVEDLVTLVKVRLEPADGALIHAGAGDVAGNLSNELQAAGFEMRRARLYDAVPAERFTTDAENAIVSGDVSLALFFSPRTATTFVRLAEAAGLAGACRNISACALSPAVAGALDPISWRGTYVASSPTMTAMLAAVDRATDEGAPPLPADGGSMSDVHAEAEAVPPPMAPAPPPRNRTGTMLLGALGIALFIVATAPFWTEPVAALLPWGREDNSAQISSLGARATSLENQTSSLDSRIAALEQAGKAPQAGDASAVPALAARVDALEKAPPASGDTSALKDTLDKEEAQIAAITARQNSPVMGEVALLAAIADLRAALSGSGPFDGELAAVTGLAAGDKAIADLAKPLAADGKSGIPSEAMLALQFRNDTAAAIKRAAATTVAPNASLKDQVIARVEALVHVTRIDDGGAPAGSTEALVDAARGSADKGDLAGAIATLQPLQGAAANAAAPWLADARRRLAAEQALAALAKHVGDATAQTVRGETH